MSNPIYITDQWQRDTITTKERMMQFEQEAQEDERHSMDMLGRLILLGILGTACLVVAWVW